MLLLDEAGYATDCVGDVGLALEMLRDSPHPMVVVIGHGEPHVEGLTILEQAGSLPPHAYLLLSTAPQVAPSISNPHTLYLVPVMAEPLDMDTLLACVDEAARRLETTHASSEGGNAPR